MYTTTAAARQDLHVVVDVHEAGQLAHFGGELRGPFENPPEVHALQSEPVRDAAFRQSILHLATLSTDQGCG